MSKEQTQGIATKKQRKNKIKDVRKGMKKAKWSKKREE